MNALAQNTEVGMVQVKQVDGSTTVIELILKSTLVLIGFEM